MITSRKLILGAMILLAGVVFAQPSNVEVRQPDVCFECHVDMTDLQGLRHQHTAFESGVCSDCHNPHASGHMALLNDEPGELCLSCHDVVADELAKHSQHTPAANGLCLDCHDPHASDFPAQLNESGAALCAGCHTRVEEWSGLPVVHEPIRQGDCSACHAAHGSDEERLLSASPPELCLGCHDVDQTFRAKHAQPGIENSNCATCHDPHASPVAGLLRANQHAPFAAGKCDACHTEGGTSFAISGSVKQLCSGCHGQVGSDETYHHNLDDEASCLNCHNPHASNASPLLLSKQQDLCMGCHFNQPELKKPKAEYVTHGGQKCSTCHQPHSADNPKYLITESVDLCNECHAGAHKSSHPIGEEVIDHRTGKQMTCLSCHQLHGPDFDKYLPLDPTMDLCLQCHKK
jgi:predicted CXXCH cytochrome family protein